MIHWGSVALRFLAVIEIFYIFPCLQHLLDIFMDYLAAQFTLNIFSYLFPLNISIFSLSSNKVVISYRQTVSDEEYIELRLCLCRPNNSSI